MTDLWQLLVAGIALGTAYALICLGFVVIYRATGVINFAQGGLLVLGAFLTHQYAVRAGFPFVVAVALSMTLAALTGVLVERVVLRRMVGQPVSAVILITLGLLFVFEQIVAALWGYNLVVLGDPWGVRTVNVAGVAIEVADVWTIALAAVVLAAFFTFFRYSRLGVAMRATASDQEAAIANGISARTIFALSWGLAGAVAALAGTLLAAGPRGVEITLTAVALRAFPAMILGGLDSPGGAVIGGLTMGLIEVMSAAYLTPNAPWLGANVHVVVPYVVMIAVLLVRPYGLFGTKEVIRA
ncbi:MAG: branched-chain amino acid ABC transporter permease [Gemmatimonadaceae bacterium]